MLSSIIARFLVTENKITKEEYANLLDELTKVRVKLGLIAVHEGLMTEEQANIVNVLQSSMDKRFGDIAVEKGFLTDDQVGLLLSKQGNPYLSLAQALENLKIMTAGELETVMNDYKNKEGLTDSDLEALKLDDVDRIIPIFLPDDSEKYIAIASLAIKTIMRCVDNNIVPLKGKYVDCIVNKKASMQFVEGNPGLSTMISSNGDDMLYLASIFGQEEFESVDMDALDAVAELINCINGMYASAESENNHDMELYPPEFSDEVEKIVGKSILNIPIIVGGSEVNLNLSLEDKIEMIIA